MRQKLGKKLQFIAMIIIVLIVTPIALAHGFGTMAGSEWIIGKNKICIKLEMSPDLINLLKGVKERYTNIDLCTDQQLQQIAVKVFKPYIDNKLTVWINGQKLPIEVGELTKKGYLYDLALSVDNIGATLKKSGNSIKINYQLFFDETDGVHVNLATMTGVNSDNNEIQNQFTADSAVWEESIDMDLASTSRSNPTNDALKTNRPANTKFTNSQESVKHPLTSFATSLTWKSLGVNRSNLIIYIIFLLALGVIGFSVKYILKLFFHLK